MNAAHAIRHAAPPAAATQASASRTSASVIATDARAHRHFGELRTRPASSSSLQLVGEPLAASVPSRRSTCRACASTRNLRIERLVIVHRRRERHEDRRQPRRRELRHCQRAGAADDEVGPGIGLRHVVDEGAHVRFDAVLRVVSRAPARCAARRPDAARRGATAASIIASAAGTTAFSRAAPWLPPITSNRSGPLRCA